MTESQYFDPSAWRLVPGRTVHVVIDDQNDFLHPDGWYATHGIDIAHMRRVIEPTKVLNAECRKRGIPILWTRHGSRGIDDGGPFMAKRVLLPEGGLRIDTWGYEILDELDVRPEDWIVAKTRLSAFFQTNLEQILRALGAETVLITGVLTNQCVGATCKDAHVPRLQADRGGGVRRHGDAAPPRARDRDDQRRLGTGEHARADARRAPRVPGRRRRAMGTIGSQFLAQDFEECVASVRKAEAAGYSHAWFVDSQILWQDCFVYMTHVLAQTERIVVGTAVTNPYTRHVTTIASTFATLAGLHPGRLACGIGRGDSAVRTMGLNPVKTVDARGVRRRAARADGRPPRDDQRGRRALPLARARPRHPDHDGRDRARRTCAPRARWPTA